MHVVWWILLTPLVVFFLYLLILRRARRLSGMPMPPFVPWFGHLFLAHKNLPRWHDYLSDLHGKFGKSYCLSLPLGPPVCVPIRLAVTYLLCCCQFIAMKPTEDNCQHLLSTNFNSYALPYFRKEILEELFGTGIFTSDGDGSISATLHAAG